MLFTLKTVKKFTFLSFFILLSAVCVLQNSEYASGGEVVGKSLRLIKGSEVTEMIKANANAKITATVVNSVIARVRAKTVSGDDKVDGNVLVTKAGANGQKILAIKGLKGGKTDINIDILPEGGKDEDVIKKVLHVTVKELKIKANDGW